MDIDVFFYAFICTHAFKVHMTQQSHSWAHIQTKLSLKKTHATRMLTAALFTIAKTWKQPKCPLTDEWIKKMWCIYMTGIVLSHKKEQNNAIFSNMDETKDSHTKWSKSERERQIPYDVTYNWNLIYGTNEPFHRKENHGLGE